jgi:hypothetical protein
MGAGVRFDFGFTCLPLPGGAQVFPLRIASPSVLLNGLGPAEETVAVRRPGVSQLFPASGCDGRVHLLVDVRVAVCDCLRLTRRVTRVASTAAVRIRERRGRKDRRRSATRDENNSPLHRSLPSRDPALGALPPSRLKINAWRRGSIGLRVGSLRRVAVRARVRGWLRVFVEEAVEMDGLAVAGCVGWRAPYRVAAVPVVLRLKPGDGADRLAVEDSLFDEDGSHCHLGPKYGRSLSDFARLQDLCAARRLPM